MHWLGTKGRRVVAGVLLVGLCVLGAACGGDDDDDAKDGSSGAKTTTTDSDRWANAPDGAGAPAQGISYVATAAGPEVQVFAEPDGAEPIQTLANPYANGVPLVFLVDGADSTAAWLPVFVPVKPNGTKGYVRASDVTVTPNSYKLRVELGAHKLTATNGAQVILETPVGLGADDMETPTGTFFIKELIQPPNPNGDYGPYAYGISAFTDNPAVANQFGGNGVVGIHGTNDPDSIGANVSHGCIRMNNEAITQLAALLPLGTPVEIVG